MITVTWEQKGDTLTLGVTGHAGSAPAGEDLICAGVTTLVYALAQTVWEAAARGELEAEPDIRLSPGDALIRATAKPAHCGTLRAAFEVPVSGARLLAAHYPEFVGVTTGNGKQGER